MDLKNALNVAVETAEAAGELLKEGLRQQKSIHHKSSAVDLVTQFDEAAEALILERMQSYFPRHSFVAEESGESGPSKNGRQSPYTWYIDPLDGTNNFAHGFPVFCVSLALYKADRPLVAVIHDPLRKESFLAVRGKGAYLTSPEASIQLQVSPTNKLIDSLLATGFPYDRHQSQSDNIAQLAAFLKRAQGIHRPGSAALDLAYVAAGRLDGYWEFKLNSWDVAAGILLVTESGGRVTAVDGSLPEFKDKVAIIASNGWIHEEMLAVLGEMKGFGEPL